MKTKEEILREYLDIPDQIPDEELKDTVVSNVRISDILDAMEEYAATRWI